VRGSAAAVITKSTLGRSVDRTRHLSLHRAAAPQSRLRQGRRPQPPGARRL